VSTVWRAEGCLLGLGTVGTKDETSVGGSLRTARRRLCCVSRWTLSLGGSLLRLEVWAGLQSTTAQGGSGNHHGRQANVKASRSAGQGRRWQANSRTGRIDESGSGDRA